MRLQQHMGDEGLIMVLEALIVIDECHRVHEINEGVGESVSGFMKKVKGILKKKKPEVSKMVEKEKGLVHYFKDMGIGGAQLMYHAFNAYYNKDQKSKDRVKELSQSVKKEHIIDILLKLDILSLHLVTGPLHIIEAVTGWNVLHNVQNKIEPVQKKIKHALHSLENLKHDLEGEMRVQLLRYTNGLRRVFDIGEFSHIKEETVTADITSPDVKIGDTVSRRLKKKEKVKKNPPKK